jgi:hypothetical protein
MSKNSIKVIKQKDSVRPSDKPAVELDEKKIVTEKDRDMRNTVKSWISERRENDNKERGRSARRLFSWSEEQAA